MSSRIPVTRRALHGTCGVIIKGYSPLPWSLRNNYTQATKTGQVLHGAWDPTTDGHSQHLLSLRENYIDATQRRQNCRDYARMRETPQAEELSPLVVTERTQFATMGYRKQMVGRGERGVPCLCWYEVTPFRDGLFRYHLTGIEEIQSPAENSLIGEL